MSTLLHPEDLPACFSHPLSTTDNENYFFMARESGGANTLSCLARVYTPGTWSAELLPGKRKTPVPFASKGTGVFHSGGDGGI